MFSFSPDLHFWFCSWWSRWEVLVPSWFNPHLSRCPPAPDLVLRLPLNLSVVGSERTSCWIYRVFSCVLQRPVPFRVVLLRTCQRQPQNPHIHTLQSGVSETLCRSTARTVKGFRWKRACFWSHRLAQRGLTGLYRGLHKHGLDLGHDLQSCPANLETHVLCSLLKRTVSLSTQTDEDDHV